MRHLFCGRWRSALPLVLVPAAAFAGSAHAAATQDRATIGRATPVVHFQGASTLGGTILNPVLCPAQSADTANTCDHVNATATDSGWVHVQVSFDPFDQFTLTVCHDNEVDPNPDGGCMLGREVARSDCADDPLGTCTLDFDATATVNYDIVIVPTFAMPGSAYSGQATFTGDGGGATTPTPGAKLKGSGVVPGTDPLRAKPPKFHLNVGTDPKGKQRGDGVKYTNDHVCRFRSTSWTGVISGNDTGKDDTTTGTADITGSGRVKLDDEGPEQDATFTVHAEDNGGHGGEQTDDDFTITVSDSSGAVIAGCSGGGKILHGQIKFEQKP